MKALLAYIILCTFLLCYSCRGGGCEMDDGSAKNFEISITKNNTPVTFENIRLIFPVSKNVALNDVPVSFASNYISLELTQGLTKDTLAIGYTRLPIETSCGWRMWVEDYKITSSTFDNTFKIWLQVNYSR